MFLNAIEARVGLRAFKLMRYLISGGTAAVSNFITLFLLVHIGHMHYLYASVLAFTMSIAVSFTMHKFWTFRDRPMHDIHIQFARYLAVLLAGLLLNTTLMYLFVEKFGVWYLFAQILAAAIIAVTNYFCYKQFVFCDRPKPQPWMPL
jgi:putative flippase GtrA